VPTTSVRVGVMWVKQSLGLGLGLGSDASVRVIRRSDAVFLSSQPQNAIFSDWSAVCELYSQSKKSPEVFCHFPQTVGKF